MEFFLLCSNTTHAIGWCFIFWSSRWSYFIAMALIRNNIYWNAHELGQLTKWNEKHMILILSPLMTRSQEVMYPFRPLWNWKYSYLTYKIPFSLPTRTTSLHVTIHVAVGKSSATTTVSSGWCSFILMMVLFTLSSTIILPGGPVEHTCKVI